MSSIMQHEQLLDDCQRHWSASATKLYRLGNTSVEKKADGVYVTDNNGKRFIDCACSYGVFVVGHRNPMVLESVQDQLNIMAWAPQDRLHSSQTSLSDRLKNIVPGKWGDVRYMVSGAEAIEQTLRYILKVQKHRRGVVVMNDSYHGKTLAAMSILGQQQHQRSYGNHDSEVTFVPYGDFSALQHAVGKGVCAVYIEPILGGAHLTVPPVGYMASVRELCNATETILVADEIQTGFGRCGKWFAVDYDQIVPDIMILSKGLTGGYTSFACALYSERLSRKHPLQQVETEQRSNGGHPLACVSALAAINYIEQHNLVGQSRVNGNLFRYGLQRLAERYPKIVKDVPGIGLMLGLRLRGSVYETLMTLELGKRGVHAGHSMNERADNPVLRFYPPLNITSEALHHVLNMIEASLEATSKRPRFVVKAFALIVRYMYHIPNTLLRRRQAS
ncbi:MULTISPECIES: aspartate aminotransferase family protein [unclassified Pseudomonas]|uniref:aspartate aminotransferase family protein n=1 Tax=unclassified Pseudomonas TaxID=196821 RepID=UPI002B231EC9|nr:MULTISPECIES: aminotransferase class III-fold pyridoxal phosphate-dependent enzyme [unclassified Pseudomonas]MEA9979786.1 aminotransferase class III-fold pyridoxal phosphate-dependent enzyme [Pseudomonas sp. RTS4]MEB0199995.1 aminotransferase class III-fold pyridoxal phosphate-dependent enzyme [Pseudomonas sp. 5S4]MEB0248429.1 aminotransferase class III-fold pyridoxal phosphate-dependent enzyme [Pseudomonas sp. 10S5]